MHVPTHVRPPQVQLTALEREYSDLIIAAQNDALEDAQLAVIERQLQRKRVAINHLRAAMTLPAASTATAAVRGLFSNARIHPMHHLVVMQW